MTKPVKTKSKTKRPAPCKTAALHGTEAGRPLPPPGPRPLSRNTMWPRFGAPDLATLVAEIHEEMKEATERGQCADYIAPLADVPLERFGLVVIDGDGRVVCAGDVDMPFSIQSVSKVFSLTLALGRVGDGLWQRVGREPSGGAFNSIVQLEAEAGRPRNPFINAGALIVADVLLAGHAPRETIGEILRFVRTMAEDDGVYVDEATAQAEAASNFRNLALAQFMRGYGNLEHAAELVVGVYTHQCALAMTCRQLAHAGRYLAFDGRDPMTGQAIVSPARARRILALMLTCGCYDESGEVAFRVGLPVKSGVGGGLLAVIPGEAVVAVWSPGLNTRGNSLLGLRALERLTEATGWSVFGGPRR